MGAVPTRSCAYALSIDVEDWFHLVGAGLDYQFKSSRWSGRRWDEFVPRVEGNVDWILGELRRRRLRGTFFILGWVADRFPALVKRIHDAGHEVASHGYWHKVLRMMTPSEFREDLRRSVGALEEITGERVLGFRASSASITDWAVEVLSDEGLLYDSSLFPASYHDVYGTLSKVDATKPIEQLPNGLWEVKFSTWDWFKLKLPWSGGGYFRLLPYRLFLQGAKQIAATRGFFQFFIHPWELDAEPPVLSGMKASYRFRRQVGIRRNRGKFCRLVDAFPFVPLRDALGLEMAKGNVGTRP